MDKFFYILQGKFVLFVKFVVKKQDKMDVVGLCVLCGSVAKLCSQITAYG